MAERREYRGASAPAKLASAIQNTTMTLTIDTVAGWPDGSIGPFTIVIDRDTSSEEKVKIASRSGNALTVATNGRGADDTSAVAHAVNATVHHCLAASDLALVNKHAADTTQDDHTQYVHVTTARSISAPHSFTGAVQFSGAPAFSGNPVFSGSPTFSGTPNFGNMGTLSDLQVIDGGAANAGVSPRPMRSDAKLKLDLVAVERAVWKAGDIKLASSTGTISSEWLECNGQAVSRTTYAALFAAIGTAYGAGDNSTTFNVPDYRDRMLSLAGAARAVGAVGGSDTHTLNTNQLPSHYHTITDPGHKHAMDGDYGNRYVVTAGSGQQNSLGGPGGTITFSDIDTAYTGITATNNIGSGAAIDNVPRWVSLRALIKAH